MNDSDYSLNGKYVVVCVLIILANVSCDGFLFDQVSSDTYVYTTFLPTTSYDMIVICAKTATTRTGEIDGT